MTALDGHAVMALFDRYYIEDGTGPLTADDVMAGDVAFAAGLEDERATLGAMIRELPVEFLPVTAGGGGGWSFLNLCNRADGVQWGEHVHMAQLCSLTMALGMSRWVMPRAMWEALPGGMPYVVFDPEGRRA